MDIIRCMPKGASIDFRAKSLRFPVRGAPKAVQGRSRDVLFIARDGAIIGMALIKAVEPIRSGRVHSRVYFEPTRSVAYALAV